MVKPSERIRRIREGVEAKERAIREGRMADEGEDAEDGDAGDVEDGDPRFPRLASIRRRGGSDIRKARREKGAVRRESGRAAAAAGVLFGTAAEPATRPAKELAERGRHLADLTRRTGARLEGPVNQLEQDFQRLTDEFGGLNADLSDIGGAVEEDLYFELTAEARPFDEDLNMFDLEDPVADIDRAIGRGLDPLPQEERERRRRQQRLEAEVDRARKQAKEKARERLRKKLQRRETQREFERLEEELASGGGQRTGRPEAAAEDPLDVLASPIEDRSGVGTNADLDVDVGAIEAVSGEGFDDDFDLGPVDEEFGY